MKVVAELSYLMQRLYMMLLYDLVDVSEVMEINSYGNSRECFICHFKYFLDLSFISANCIQWLPWFDDENNRFSKSCSCLCER